MIAAFADIVELARSKLAGSKTGLAYAWMLMLEGCLAYILTNALKLIIDFQLYNTLKINWCSFFTMLSVRGRFVTFSVMDPFPFYILRNVQFCLKVCCAKFGKKNVVMLEWIS